MLKIKYKNQYSTFNDDSELYEIITNSLFIDKNVKLLKFKSINIEETQKIIKDLNSLIKSKLTDGGENDKFKRIKSVLFGREEILLNLTNNNHKDAFFLIKTYNLFFCFLSGPEGELIIESDV
jgi:hypothetical protein